MAVNGVEMGLLTALRGPALTPSLARTAYVCVVPIGRSSSVNSIVPEEAVLVTVPIYVAEPSRKIEYVR